MILVVGGAGYIGSHMVKYLYQQGKAVLTLDNLSTGFRDAVRYGHFLEADLSNTQALADLFAHHRVEAVMHFASLSQVGESVQHPQRYYQNNVVNTLYLLDAMRTAGVTHFIFSSTAATFGEPQYSPIDEAHPQHPINPYWQTKLMVEKILDDYDRAYGLKSIVLRYFNAAGADPEGELGERHDPETHLIPLVLQAASGRRPHIAVMGRDYDTADGTCVRDYIHVHDLCQAHAQALELLMAGGSSAAYNLGNGQGFSVQEVIDAAQRVTGRQIKVIDAPRRSGDPTCLVANAERALAELAWQPKYAALDTMIAHAWAWEMRSQ
jgi:UDP-glucose 4-epimerase